MSRGSRSLATLSPFATFPLLMGGVSLCMGGVVPVKDLIGGG